MLIRWDVVVAWVVAGAWALKTGEAAWGLPRIPDLLREEFDRWPVGWPRLTVIVPARDEEEGVVACLESLMAQDYPGLHVIAVDDRSSDATGALMDALAVRFPERLTVMHVTELPAGWLGKVHALALGAKQAEVLTQPEFLLFTDGDVVFRADALRRTLARVVDVQADHMVTVPTMDLRRWDEGVVLGFFQIFGLWATRPWKVEDPKAMRDVVGIGAFNLMRTTAYRAIGGFEGQKMDILEDFTLAKRVKKAGLRQRICFGHGLVTVHWASGAKGLVGVMTKNIFSAFRFHASLLLGACVWLAVFAVGPSVGVWMPGVRVPSAIALLCAVWAYRLYGRTSGISAWYAAGFPVGALLFIFTLLRSMAVTLRQGGVWWRGTFYSLEDLRREAGPLG
jgi:cellulose synthase/poly-beta-1,6-N-acetylglucosamine synthase-like glycosyltransferase